MLNRLAAEGWAAERLGEEAGATLSVGEPWPDRGRWLLLAVAASDLAADAEERAAAMIATARRGRRAAIATAAGNGGSADIADAVDAVEAREIPTHWALPGVWQPPDGEQPAMLALPAPGTSRVDALLPARGVLAPPELLGRLLLAELLDGLAAAHGRGFWHGLLTPGSLWLAGAPPERLIADCPRDPRVVIVGCGVLAMLTPRGRAAAVARAAREWVAPELRRGDEPGPAADVWAAAAVVRALLPTGGSAALQPLLDAMQAQRPEARPTALAAALDARELALTALAAWQRGAPPPPRLVPSPAPLLPAPGTRPRVSPSVETAAVHSAAMSREAGAAGGSARWTLQLPSSRSAIGLLPPLPFVGRPLAAASGLSGPGLWLSMAPTAMAGILSVLLAMALLFAAQ